MNKEDNNKTSQDNKTVKVDFNKKSQAQSKSSGSKDFFAKLLEASGMNGDDEKKPKKRPYLHFKEFGLVIPFWAIVSLEKFEEYVRDASSGHGGWKFGIVINQGVESSPNMPFGERRLLWDRANIRDDKFDTITRILAEHNYELNEI